MDSERTQEQKEADNALTSAIEAAMKAYGIDWGLLTDYIVVTSQQKFTANGEMITRYTTVHRDSDIPHYRIIGLLRTATMQVENSFMNDPQVTE